MDKKSGIRKLLALIRLTRPPNGVMMFIAVLVGILFSESRNAAPQAVALAFLTAYGLSGSSMAINDYFDRHVDAINSPDRPIPSGLVPPTSAIILSAILGCIGLAASVLVSTQCFILASISYAAAMLYNSLLKSSGLPGNLLVSFTVVAPFVYGSLMSDGMIGMRVAMFALLAFISNTGREIIKGISDVEGDALRGVRSVARLFGEKRAALLGAAIYTVAVALSPIPYFLGYVSHAYLPVVAAADAGFVYSSISIIRKPDKENALRVKRQTLLWMVIALASFIAGGLLG